MLIERVEDMNQSNFYPGNPSGNTYPGTPIYSGNNMIPNQQTAPTSSGEFPLEQSYIENILRLNKGKKVDVYMTFPDSTEWRDVKYTGIIEQAGRDHIIISNPSNGEWYLLLSIYIDYFKFYEKINYSPEFIPNI